MAKKQSLIEAIATVGLSATRAPGDAPSTLCSSLNTEAIANGVAAGDQPTSADTPTYSPIGRYRIESILGEGGFGRVYLAFDDQLKRRVAIKVPHARHVASARDAAPYLAEAQTLASLDHRHIVPVYDVGSTPLYPCYVVSKYIEGASLDRLIQVRRLSHAETVELVASVAEALHHAHKSGRGSGLVHRDVKPANILLDREGVAYVADFGLALCESDLGKGSGYVGTPIYMSPEQAGGQANRVDGRSDVYSLGTVFYELLAGRRPFRAENAKELLQLILHQPPKPPRQIDDTIPLELERICLKALAKDPAQRYTTAKDFASDLRAFALSLQSTVGSAGRRTAVLHPSGRIDPPARPRINPDATAAAAKTVLYRCSCGKSYRVSESQVGQNVKCSVCKKVTRLVRPPDHRERVLQPPEAPLAVAIEGSTSRRTKWGIGLASLAAAAVACVVGLAIVSSRGSDSHEGAVSIKLAQIPTGLQVRVDGKLLSMEQLKASLTLPPGPHHLLVIAPGYEMWSQEFTVAPGENPPRDVELAKSLTPAPNPKDPTAPLSKSEQQQLAADARDVLKQHCYQCHGRDKVEADLHVLKSEVWLDPKQGFVVAGALEESRIWQQVGMDGTMPPGERKPSLAERETLKRWILAGAPAVEVEAPRGYRSAKDEMTVILRHLRSVTEDRQRFQRYFTLANLHNNSFEKRLGRNNTNVDAVDLRLARAALSKLLNSLSRQSRISVPKPLDEDATVFQIDLRNYDWTEEQWNIMRQAYPHGLKLNESRDQELADAAAEIYRRAGTDVPCLRVDWFVAHASRSPLYEKLLGLPADVLTLERQLGVDTEKNFLDNSLQRAGFINSGVSVGNRLVERNLLNVGAYWKSYDFASSKGRAEISRHPLGPEFEKNEFKAESFRADGGEMIFTLPNGLQGYFLADGKGKFLVQGPVQVVRDSQETAGTPEVVNGLSCIGCHQHGMIHFRDDIREGTGLSGKAFRKVQDLFPAQEEMDKLLKDDERRFLEALEKAIGPFVQVGEDAATSIRQFREPLSVVARLYYRQLEIDDVAADLGFPFVDRLKNAIQDNKTLRQGLGLGPLVQGAPIKRDNWSDQSSAKSQFQLVSEELDLGLAVPMAPPSKPVEPSKPDVVAVLVPPKPEEVRPTVPPSLTDPPDDLPAKDTMPPRPPPRPHMPKTSPTITTPPTPEERTVHVVLSNGRRTGMKVVLTHNNVISEFEINGAGSKRIELDLRGEYNVQVYQVASSGPQIVGKSAKPREIDYQYLGWFTIYPAKSADSTIDLDKAVNAYRSARH